MSVYQFLTDQDLDLGMKKYFRDLITVGAEKKHILVSCEAAAVSLIKTKLNNKYDLTKLFPSIVEWATDGEYTTGQYVHKNTAIYIALQDSTDKNPTDPANAAFWKQSDPRDQLLVKYCATITAYFMMEAGVNPRMISEKLVDEFAGVIEWLDDVRDGKESPAWDLLASGGSYDIPHGSNDKLDFDY